jgi:hypothetical protein
MIKYAWYSCGYIKQDPGPFENAREICFSFEVAIVGRLLVVTKEASYAVTGVTRFCVFITFLLLNIDIFSLFCSFIRTLFSLN